MTLALHKTFTIVTCYKCGIDFGMPDAYTAQRRNDGETWYCPNGHGQVFGDTAAKKLERVEQQLARANARETHLRDQRDAAERSASAYKGQVTKIKKRVGNGVCPCCNRSFQNLHRHMAGQHPDFTADEHA